MAMAMRGSITVELFTPLNYAGRVVERVVLQVSRYEHTARWQRGEFHSALALMAELSDLPERVLRQAMAPDMDRLTIALFAQARFAQTDVLVEDKIPFSTPEELLPPVAESGVTDPIDPRFPVVEGPVRRFPTPPPGPGFPQPPKPPEQPTDPLGPQDNLELGLAPPDVVRTARNG